MSLPSIILTYSFAAATPARRLVVAGASDHEAAAATGAGAPILGVTEQAHAIAAGRPGDVVVSGIAVVEAGAAAARGSYVTADASGRAVVAAPAAGVNANVAGVLLESAGAAGDFVRVLLAQSRIQG
jgi:hypothetical protein